MNREKLFDSLADIDDAYIAEALRYSPEAASGSSERIVHLNKKKIISFALAAALILALGVAAYAVFSTYSTRVPEPEETFRINWAEMPAATSDGRTPSWQSLFPRRRRARRSSSVPAGCLRNCLP